MELSILDSAGLPDGSILSVRSGPTRRQSPLPCELPFRLPAGPWPLRIDVLALLGKSRQGATIGKLDADGCCKVPLEARDGRMMSVTLQVSEGKGATTRAKVLSIAAEEGAGDSSMPVRRRDTEAVARAYLDRHRLHEFMHTLFELLLRERPTDPYSFIAGRFREAAAVELANLTADEAKKKPVLSKPMSPDVKPETLSTTPSTAMWRELSAPAPDGGVELSIQNIRGRLLMRCTVPPTETVIALKARLESALGVAIESQQLLWWAETLPNNTTLEDHGIPSGSGLHLVCSSREPRLMMSLSGASDGGLRLWSLENGELMMDLVTDPMPVVWALSVDWPNMRAISGSANGVVHMWDLSNQTCVATIESHTEEVITIESNWSIMRALTGSGDGTVKVWDLENKKVIQTLLCGCTVFALAPDWKYPKVYVGLKNGVVTLLDLNTGVELASYIGGVTAAASGGTSMSAIAIDAVSQRAVSGLEDGHLLYWHLQGSSNESTGGEKAKPKVKMLLAHYCAIRAIQAHWAETNSRALCGSDDGSLSMWSLDNHYCVIRCARHIGFVWAIHVDWSKDRAITGAFDGCTKLWDLRTGECLRTLQCHSRPVRSITAG